jgi:hypothetical protein
MITKIRTKGSNCTHILSPPNGLLAWAKAGVTNISLSFVVAVCGASAGLLIGAPRTGAAAVDRATKSARTITATGPIATPVCPQNPGDSALQQVELAGAQAPR